MLKNVVKNKFFIRNILLALLAILLVACASQPQTKMSLTAARYLNPDVNGNPSPLVVTFYDLKDPFKFKQASFDQLSNNASKVLGSNLIDKNVIEIRPGIQKKVSQPLSPNTKYIGIVAAYRNIDHAKWQSLLKIPKGAKRVAINLNLESEGLVASIGKDGWL